MNGIVLDVYNHKEWDKKFVFFSKEFGIINIVGIGLQRPKSKLRSYITRFCNISVDVVHGKTGYRLVRAVSNNQGFFLYKKEAYFILNKTTKLIQELLPIGAPHINSFLLFVSLSNYLENNIVLDSNSNKIFYKNALNLLSALGYRKEAKLVDETVDYNENNLIKEYVTILSENGLANVIFNP
ncbi:hypothetical protein A3C57_00720 [Candidatus Nomurabacteria bacterium RIFCSPHIGHO2_02_FULL_33_12]|nr:MAG: hypothetical protein A3C57_00720 [Candidatus Nomurabacteria bacterium RIFCSPHIGHO2_02_FULL_33_12]